MCIDRSFCRQAIDVYTACMFLAILHLLCYCYAFRDRYARNVSSVSQRSMYCNRVYCYIQLHISFSTTLMITQKRIQIIFLSQQVQVGLYNRQLRWGEQSLLWFVYFWYCFQSTNIYRSEHSSIHTNTIYAPVTCFINKVNPCISKSPLIWIGLDLFNDETHLSGHISRPTQGNVSQNCCPSLNKSFKYDYTVHVWGIVEINKLHHIR